MEHGSVSTLPNKLGTGSIWIHSHFLRCWEIQHNVPKIFNPPRPKMFADWLTTYGARLCHRRADIQSGKWFFKHWQLEQFKACVFTQFKYNLLNELINHVILAGLCLPSLICLMFLQCLLRRRLDFMLKSSSMMPECTGAIALKGKVLPAEMNRTGQAAEAKWPFPGQFWERTSNI